MIFSQILWSTRKINSVIGFIWIVCGDIFSGSCVLWYCSVQHGDGTNCSTLLLFPIKLINFCVSMCFLGHFYGAEDVSKFFNSIYVTIERRDTRVISITLVLCLSDNWNTESVLYILLSLLSWICLIFLFVCEESQNLSHVIEKLDSIDCKHLQHHVTILCQIYRCFGILPCLIVAIKPRHQKVFKIKSESTVLGWNDSRILLSAGQNFDEIVSTVMTKS